MNIINITIDNKEHIFEKYNNKEVSKQLLNYIIDSAITSQALNYKIIIKTEIKEDYEKIIKEGLKKELELNFQEKNLTNLKQIYLIFLGAIFIGLSIYLKKI